MTNENNQSDFRAAAAPAEDVEGHLRPLNAAPADDDVEGHRIAAFNTNTSAAAGDDDVQGHLHPLNAAPEDDDVQGHLRPLNAAPEDEVEGHIMARSAPDDSADDVTGHVRTYPSAAPEDEGDTSEFYGRL